MSIVTYSITKRMHSQDTYSGIDTVCHGYSGGGGVRSVDPRRALQLTVVSCRCTTVIARAVARVQVVLIILIARSTPINDKTPNYCLIKVQ